jgi:hypothetical protein
VKAALALAALALAGCASVADLPADPAATLDPIAFFTGRSHGEGRLHVLLSGDGRIRVDSVGCSDGKHGLILTQIIREGDKPPRKRIWRMRRAGPGRFTGELTDAAGPVEIAVQGPRATIRYTMKNGLAVTQHLALQKDRRTILNRLVVSKFGIRLARLDETIRKTSG